MARNYSSVIQPRSLAAPVTSTAATTITLNDAAGLPAAPFVLVINPDTASEEVVLVTNVNGSVLTVTRALEADGLGNGIARTHAQNNIVKHMIVGSDLQIVHDHFSQTDTTNTSTVTAHGVTGGVVGRTNAQTLTNKTIALGSNTITGTKAQFNTAMTDDDFATVAGTENLLAKTLTSPVITGGTVNGGAALTVDSTELNYVDGVTSSIQTQLTAGSTALTTHAALTLSAHGIANTSKLPNIASASAGRTIFVQAAQPTALAVGDIWFQVTGL
jgi:hypothetical protein